MLLLSATAFAGSLSVTPVRVELSNAQRSVALTVRNDGDQPTVVQAQLVAWSQENNDDKLDPTNDLIASPPIFTVAAGGAQVVRVALRRPPDATVQKSYRILVTEVPGKAQPGFTGAQFALKISVPIFIEAATARTEPKLGWSARKLPSGELAVTTTNTGSRHIQVHSVDLAGVTSDASDVDGKHASMWYVLPGQSRTVTVRPLPGREFSADRVRIRAETDAGPIATDVVIDAR